MCGRFTLYVPYAELIERFSATAAIVESDYEASYNIAPSQQVVAVINDGNRNRLGKLKWGLIPRWADDPKIGSRLINARAETVADKPSFREAFKRRRCLIPADSFYEWKKADGQKKPMRIRLKGEEVFGIAGLWETWVSPDGEKVHSCTAITTKPNGLMAEIHDRMPVILPKEKEALWLDPGNRDTEALRELLVPFDAARMEAYEVSPGVNSPKNNGPELIVPYC
ncbi:SOS response-associated peptidase [Edaphobacillus lindanitolerans]|uniref:Abasic site processing protein n=1 Tax=Edaphobacillus lindanitolerans TaxID=550447 RepID=A0A1U7PPX8_9BACI|nr:SOS response-associated peptidase [Edaphobacillus lindanitolerans]SIT83819.1 Putative SOS response-associated peptidase YedK [Edaphobacillus lindanitolerans]